MNCLTHGTNHEHERHEHKVEAVNPPDGDEIGWVHREAQASGTQRVRGARLGLCPCSARPPFFNTDSPNAALELRLPDNTAYFTAVKEIMVQYWNGTGVYTGLSVEDGAILATANCGCSHGSITAAGGRELAMENYKKELCLYGRSHQRSGLCESWTLGKRQRPRLFPARALTGLTPIFGNRGGIGGLGNVGRTLHETKSETPAKPDRAILNPFDMLLKNVH